MKLLQAILKVLNPTACVTTFDGLRTSVTACDREIGSKGMGFGV